jgi:hypothetical protein
VKLSLLRFWLHKQLLCQAPVAARSQVRQLCPCPTGDYEVVSRAHAPRAATPTSIASPVGPSSTLFLPPLAAHPDAAKPQRPRPQRAEPHELLSRRRPIKPRSWQPRSWRAVSRRAVSLAGHAPGGRRPDGHALAMVPRHAALRWPCPCRQGRSPLCAPASCLSVSLLGQKLSFVHGGVHIWEMKLR